MPNRPRPRTASRCFARAALLLATAASSAAAQEIEPRAYSNVPVGVNFLIAGYAYATGALSTDPSLPLNDPQLRTSNAFLAYARGIDLWGRSAKVDASIPFTWLSGKARYEGETLQREVDGLGDARFRLSVNLCGAPALTLKEFAGWRQDLIVGASLQVTAPLGQYDNNRLINIGTNRWSFKPEVGVSKAIGRWTVEGAASATLYTGNDEFFGDSTRAQDPLYALQGHAIYNFPSGIWGSLDLTYFTGGETTLDDTARNDLQRNWRLGGTLAFPVDRRNSVKLYASSGVSARTGNNYDLVGLAWQHRWGGGL